MALTMPKTSGGGDFELCPAGNHLAICYRVIDLGTQEVTYDGQTKHQRKVYLGWEVPDETMEDGRPFTIGKRYTWSSHEKSTLRKHLEAWRSKPFTDSDLGEGGFHIKKVLGVPCMLQIVHTTRDGKTYANVDSVTSVNKRLAVECELTNEPIFFSLEEDELDLTVLDSLSEGMLGVIAQSPEYAAAMSSRGGGSVTVPAGDSGSDDGEESPF